MRERAALFITWERGESSKGACATSHEGLRQVEGATLRGGNHNSRVWRQLSKRLATTQVWCHLSTLKWNITQTKSPSWEIAPKGRRKPSHFGILTQHSWWRWQVPLSSWDRLRQLKRAQSLFELTKNMFKHVSLKLACADFGWII